MVGYLCKKYFLVGLAFFYSLRGHHVNKQLFHLHPHKVVSQVFQVSFWATICHLHFTSVITLLCHFVGFSICLHNNNYFGLDSYQTYSASTRSTHRDHYSSPQKYSSLWCEPTSAATAALGQPDRGQPVNGHHWPHLDIHIYMRQCRTSVFPTDTKTRDGMEQNSNRQPSCDERAY